MTDGADSRDQPTVEHDALAAESPAVPAADAPLPPLAPSALDGAGSAPAAPAADRPELLVGAAFAGGLALALLLKRLGR